MRTSACRARGAGDRLLPKQTMTAGPIKMLGGLLATAMSIGAVFAAMNTMYASVARARGDRHAARVGLPAAHDPASSISKARFPAGLGGRWGAGWRFGAVVVRAFGVRFGTLSFNTFSEVIFSIQRHARAGGAGDDLRRAGGHHRKFLPGDPSASRPPVIAALKSI